MALAVVGGMVGAALVSGAVASAIGSRRFRARFEGEKAELLRRGRTGAPPVSAGSAEELPPPVRRYLEAARAFARPGLRVATLKQRGTIRTGADRPWMPFEAEQAYAIEPPGFVWLATARVAPLVRIMALDSFVDGRGRMRIRALGVLPIADATGPEMDLGAGLRHWAEILVFPEVVRSAYLRWEPVDDRHARVLVQQGELTLSALVEFGADGHPVAFHAHRQREVGGRHVLTPWSGHFSEWRPIDRRPFPTRWESVWHLPERDFVAVRLEVLAVAVE